MKRFISYPSIDQYRQVIRTVKHQAQYQGLDDDGEPIYDRAAVRPIVKFHGTVKLHGSNAGVAYNFQDGMWAQSRKNIITVEKDNAGFAFFLESHKASFQRLFDTIISRENITIASKKNIVIFGEWCGGNIQKSVAITGLEKMFMIFGVKIAPFDADPEIVSYWTDHKDLSSHDDNIYNIEDYQTFELDIDFNRPDVAQAEMVKLVEAVEEECPVGKAFGRTSEDNQVGEGIVWSGTYKGDLHRFKTKGEKHSISKVKVIAPVDVEKMDNIMEFVEAVVTENRLNQAIEQVFTIESIEPTVKMMGDFIRWVVGDIMKEEMDTMTENGFEPKDVNKHISTNARCWFQIFLDKQVMA